MGRPCRCWWHSCALSVWLCSLHLSRCSSSCGCDFPIAGNAASCSADPKIIKLSESLCSAQSQLCSSLQPGQVCSGPNFARHWEPCPGWQFPAGAGASNPWVHVICSLSVYCALISLSVRSHLVPQGRSEGFGPFCAIAGIPLAEGFLPWFPQL